MSVEKNEAYYNSLDKRTKEYKEWKAKQPHKGIGDVVETVLEKTGVAKVAKFILGEDCKCNERRDALNKIWPFKNIQCLEEDEYQFLHEWFAVKRFKITHAEHDKIVSIYNRTFNTKSNVSNCVSCINEKLQELKKLYLQYKTK